MKLFSTNRYTAAGAVGALAIGTALSAGVLSPASAVEKTLESTYNCTIAGTPAALPVTTVMDIPAQVTAGQQVPGMDVSMGVPLPGAIVTVIRGAGITELAGTVTGATFGVGALGVPGGNLAAPLTDVPLTGGMMLPVAGATKSFTAPAAGSYPVTLPDAFTFTPTGLPVPIPCELADGAPSELGFLEVLTGTGGEEPEPTEKQDSTTVAKIKNAPVTVGERGRLRIRVTDEDGAAEGKVVVRLDGERLRRPKELNDRGRTGVRLPKLNRGKHVVVVRYLGNGDTERSRDRVRFRVRRG